jgi:ABC-type uncharacterized transport system permease subunit
LNGLQLEAGVPRELGSALIALFVLFVSAAAIWRRVRAAPASNGIS